MCALFIANFFRALYSKLFITGSLPHDWKVACVVSVYKSGAGELVNNYRPISPTSLDYKLIKNTLCSNVMTHITYQNLIPRQHEFRRGLFCITQLTEFTHEVCIALNE